MQSEIHDAVAAARAADEEEALRDGDLSGAPLFNPLYQLDVERLNEAIEQVRAWLPVRRSSWSTATASSSPTAPRERALRRPFTGAAARGEPAACS